MEQNSQLNGTTSVRLHKCLSDDEGVSVTLGCCGGFDPAFRGLAFRVNGRVAGQ